MNRLQKIKNIESYSIGLSLLILYTMGTIQLNITNLLIVTSSIVISLFFNQQLSSQIDLENTISQVNKKEKPILYMGNYYTNNLNEQRESERYFNTMTHKKIVSRKIATGLYLVSLFILFRSASNPLISDIMLLPIFISGVIVINTTTRGHLLIPYFITLIFCLVSVIIVQKNLGTQHTFLIPLTIFYLSIIYRKKTFKFSIKSVFLYLSLFMAFSAIIPNRDNLYRFKWLKNSSPFQKKLKSVHQNTSHYPSPSDLKSLPIKKINPAIKNDAISVIEQLDKLKEDLTETKNLVSKISLSSNLNQLPNGASLRNPLIEHNFRLEKLIQEASHLQSSTQQIFNENTMTQANIEASLENMHAFINKTTNFKNDFHKDISQYFKKTPSSYDHNHQKPIKRDLEKFIKKISQDSKNKKTNPIVSLNQNKFLDTDEISQHIENITELSKSNHPPGILRPAKNDKYKNFNFFKFGKSLKKIIAFIFIILVLQFITKYLKKSHIVDIIDTRPRYRTNRKIREEYAKIKTLKLSPYEFLIQTFNFFLNATHQTYISDKEASPPPKITGHLFGRQVKSLAKESSIMADIFCQCFYGNKKLHQKTMKNYKRALKKILKHFRV